MGNLIRGRGGVYRFSGNTTPPLGPHLVTVANNALFNPDAGDFAVTVARSRRRGPQSNVARRAGPATAGGFWKVEILDGLADLPVPGRDGQQRAVSCRARVDNGACHTVPVRPHARPR